MNPRGVSPSSLAGYRPTRLGDPGNNDLLCIIKKLVLKLKSLLQKHGLRGHKAPPAEMDNPSFKYPSKNIFHEDNGASPSSTEEMGLWEGHLKSPPSRDGSPSSGS